MTDSNPAPISIIIPVLNEAASLAASLTALQPLRARGHEVLVVDGGSRDNSVTVARKQADRVLLSGTGRALQLNAGSESASHDILLFLSADLRLPPDADQLIAAALQASAAQWGRFDVQFEQGGGWGRLRAAMINWRAALTQTAVASQALFVHRHCFERARGFDSVPRHEIRVLSRKLQRYSGPVRVNAVVRASLS